ncbi:hypothetical protein EW146_g4792 [Bondarzewia mesenterica]|uniref:Uncharacterized protein n=1 Tax=Bondarzewia mesenterica TaxID=1095465 RepID=A0A4V3XF10_9AGAM|nr:hypothetical protein EW146_g4792 [Bondarzewia mesenterica]
MAIMAFPIHVPPYHHAWYPVRVFSCYITRQSCDSIVAGPNYLKLSRLMSVTKKTVLITGCSAGGIGHALALEFHAKGTDTWSLLSYTDLTLTTYNYMSIVGLRVVATARNPQSMQGLVDKGIETLTLDVTSMESIIDARDKTAMLMGGKLDILVNNA